ncbi:MAG: PAS domain-containing protein, partial [Gemmatimonadetes bacterium]|nr:PAS domain-containing protein [Gemmatimonadota bacterium]
MTELATAASVSPLSLLSASPDGVLAYDRECRITFWNPAMERLSGVPAAEAAGRCCGDVLPLLRDLGEPALAEAALAGEVAVGSDWELTVPATGDRVWVEARYAPVRDESGEVCGCVATLREVGDRHHAAAAAEARGASAMEALRRSEERYRTLVESGTQMVWTTDARGMVVDMPFWRELTGQSLEDVREEGWASAIHPDDRARVLAAWWGAYETRTVYKAEYRLRLADGSYRWFLARGAPVMEPDGSIREWVGAFNDVHDRRLAEAALRESEERYRLAMLATRDVVWDWDLATDEVRFGDSIRQVLGFRPGDVAPDANWWYDHIHADDRDRVVASVHEAIRSRAEVWMDSYRHLRADGSWAQVEDRAFLLYGEDGQPVRMVGATQDVTERRLAEAARENERLRLRRVLAQMPAAVSVHEGPELVFVALSDAMRRLIGGRDVLGLPARSAIPELASQGFVDELERVYRTGERFTQTAVSAWWDGDGDGVAEEHVVDYAYEPLLDGEGHVYGVVSHVAEVTGRERAARELADARREAEVRADEAARLARELAEKAEALQVRVDESRRLAAELRTANHDLRAASTRAEEAREEALAANRAKDGFLATMSHELRTPLNAMIGYVDLLLMGIPDPIPVSAQAYVERIRLASRHLLSIIEEILTFSRIEAGRETPEVEEVDLAVLSREVSAIIDPL